MVGGQPSLQLLLLVQHLCLCALLVVGGQPKLQLLLLLLQHLCLACFVQIEKCYVFSHHFSLPGEWDS